MEKIYIDREQEMTPTVLGNIISHFDTTIKPKLKFNQGYYDGTGQAIMRRTMSDPTKPNNRIVKNYCLSIVDNFQGYLAGIPVTYSANEDDDISILLDVLKENDVVNTDSEFLANALIYGISYEICYVNEKSEKRFRNIDPTQVIPIYADDMDEELLYCIYYHPITS